MNEQIIINELNRKFYEYLEIERLNYTRREFVVNQAPQMVSTLIGSRRSGKSYRLIQVVDDAIEKKIISGYRYVCQVDFDNPILSQIKGYQFNIITIQFLKINEGFNLNTPIIFLFDEIQKIEGWELFVIELSRNTNWQVFVTGSSSRMLRGDISTELRGKAISTECYPFSFSEFLTCQGTDIKSRSASGIASITRQFDQYLQWGGFPIIPSLEERMRNPILKEYFDTMLLKDIIERYNVSKPQQCIYLIRFLLSNISKPFTHNSAFEAVKSTGMPTSKDSVAEYIQWACDAFLCYTIPIFSSSMKEQNRNYSKLYAVDWALSSVNNWVWDGMHSRSLENIVFIQLLRKGKKVNYYLTREKRQEIDFVVSNANGEIQQLIQICWSLDDNQTLKREVDPLITSMPYFGLKESFIITLNETDEIVTGSGIVRVIPAWKWLIEDH
jgi:uncharacterized protein